MDRILLRVGDTVTLLWFSSGTFFFLSRAESVAQQLAVLATFRGARAHEYDWLLRIYADRGGPGLPTELVPHFARTNAWSTDMRYSPGTVELREAEAFLDSAIEIIKWADGRR